MVEPSFPPLVRLALGDNRIPGYTLIVEGQRIPLRAGDEYFIADRVSHAGEVVAGTRTIHAFGGHRADRAGA